MAESAPGAGGRSLGRRALIVGALAAAVAVSALLGWRLRDPAAETAGEPASSLRLAWFAAPAPVEAGEEAAFAVQAAPGAVCTPRLELRSGASRAAGLATRQAPPDGLIRWRWRIASTTAPGRWPLIVTCIVAGRQAALETFLDVKPPR